MKQSENGNWGRLLGLERIGNRAVKNKIKLRDNKRNKKKIAKTLALKRD